MRGWVDIVEAVDERVAETIEAGLFSIDGEHRYVVTDTFDTGTALAEVVSKWQGTVVPAALEASLGRHGTRAFVDQEVRLRLLRAL